MHFIQVSYYGFLLEIKEILTAFFQFTIIPGLDHAIGSLNIEGRRFITQKLNGKYHDGKQFVLLVMISLSLFLY